DAFAWVKPPGESDGVSGPAGVPRLDRFCDPGDGFGRDSMGGAPQAGEWFHDQFAMLVRNANPPLSPMDVDPCLLNPECDDGTYDGFNFKRSGRVEWSLGCDWVGNDITTVSGASESCGDHCIRTSGCTHFAWTYNDGGTCWLKGSRDAPELVASTHGMCGFLHRGDTSGNPYASVKQFVNPRYGESILTSMKRDPSIARLANTVRTFPTAVWLDRLFSTLSISPTLNAAAEQAKGQQILVQFVIYNLPGRDCKAFASAGEIPKGGMNTYKMFIDQAALFLKQKASNIRLSLIIEPDSLPNLATNIGTNQCDETTEKEYPEGVAYAIAKLSEIPNTHLYLDAGHGGWLGWPDGMEKVAPVFKRTLERAKQINPRADIRGFAASVANYSPFSSTECPAKELCPLTTNKVTKEINYDWNPSIDEDRFTRRLNAYLGAAGLPTRWIVDTSRSGKAKIRSHWGSWCNAKGAGMGQPPQANPAPQVDAFTWIKPPGESDGVSGPAGVPRLDRFCDPGDKFGRDAMGGAPQAGEWFHE
ncbi:hypothetical protein HDU67_003164, partial [Dinochytrium kinnereticum]